MVRSFDWSRSYFSDTLAISSSAAAHQIDFFERRRKARAEPQRAAAGGRAECGVHPRGAVQPGATLDAMRRFEHRGQFLRIVAIDRN